MANDPTVKAEKQWGRHRQKIVRLRVRCIHELPVFWLVDSAGARITDQVQMFPGRRGAGRIFYNQVKLSGRVPQICCLFRTVSAGAPSPARRRDHGQGAAPRSTPGLAHAQPRW